MCLCVSFIWRSLHFFVRDSSFFSYFLVKINKLREQGMVPTSEKVSSCYRDEFGIKKKERQSFQPTQLHSLVLLYNWWKPLSQLKIEVALGNLTGEPFQVIWNKLGKWIEWKYNSYFPDWWAWKMYFKNIRSFLFL